LLFLKRRALGENDSDHDTVNGARPGGLCAGLTQQCVQGPANHSDVAFASKLKAEIRSALGGGVGSSAHPSQWARCAPDLAEARSSENMPDIAGHPGEPGDRRCIESAAGRAPGSTTGEGRRWI